MDRRYFLSTTALGGLAVAALAKPARALSVQDCSEDPDGAVCSELVRHDNLRTQIEALLTERGVSDDQRKAVLAAAICPFCGQPLFG